MKQKNILLNNIVSGRVEVGCDEAGRGCLAGPVFAAAVVLPIDFKCSELNDSKQLTEKKRQELRLIIEKEAISYGIGVCSPQEIDELNILWASVEAMHRAIDQLTVTPDHILVDGNRFKPYKQIEHSCIVGGDAKYLSIAAASVLAKTYRDAYMIEIHSKFPFYDWDKNKGYPTQAHKMAIQNYGVTSHHRQSFNLFDRQMNIKFDKSGL